MSWSWSYGSWIYNYLCNQYLSPLTLWVRIQLRRGVLDTTLCDKVCQCLRLVGGFLRVPTRYNWNIVKGGVKHQKPTKSKLRKFLIIFCICLSYHQIILEQRVVSHIPVDFLLFEVDLSWQDLYSKSASRLHSYPKWRERQECSLNQGHLQVIESLTWIFIMEWYQLKDKKYHSHEYLLWSDIS